MSELSHPRSIPTAFEVALVPDPSDAAPYTPGLLRHGLRVLRQQAGFIAVALAYLIAGYIVTRLYDQNVRLGLYNGTHAVIYLNFALAWIGFVVVRALLRERPDHPLRFAWQVLIERCLSPRRLVHAAPAFVLLPAVISMTTAIKRMIPVVQPFAWDPILAEVDRWLHGGVAPWEWLQPIVGYPSVTVAISIIYSLPWFVLVLLMQFWHTFTLDRRRLRFLITYVLCWAVQGNVIATALSSAGPIYYGRLFSGPDPFAPLVEYLSSVAQTHVLPSYLAQEYLWNSYQQDFLRLGSGISAMPSLHIAMGLLLVLSTWHLHRAVRVATLSFLIVLQIGAVHLGWHYAIDGYVALILTGTLWWGVGRCLDTHRRRGARAPDAGGRSPSQSPVAT